LDRSECKRIVDREIEALAEAMGLPHWHIVVRYERVADEHPEGFTVSANCRAKPEYERATITIDPDEMDDEAELLRILRHELMHIVLAPFNLYRGFATAFVEQKSTADAQEDAIWAHSVEQGVRSLERLWFSVERYWRDRIADEAKAKTKADAKARRAMQRGIDTPHA
jgi:hypothetical protein